MLNNQKLFLMPQTEPKKNVLYKQLLEKEKEIKILGQVLHVDRVELSDGSTEKRWLHLVFNRVLKKEQYEVSTHRTVRYTETLELALGIFRLDVTLDAEK